MSSEADFGPRLLSDLFIAQDRRPDHLSDIDLTSLTPFERGWLVMVGLVTQLIEAYALEPVQVRQLWQDRRAMSADDEWLQVEAGHEVISRQVLLTGARTARAYVHGEALIVSDRLPVEVQEDLYNSKMGLGQILQHRNIETRGELLWCGLENVAEVPEPFGSSKERPAISRTYRFIHQGAPAVLITERFQPPVGY